MGRDPRSPGGAKGPARAGAQGIRGKPLRQHRPARASRALVALAALAALAALGHRALAPAPARAQAAEDGRVRVALLPMVVHSAENPEYLREGLADMLASRLEQVDGLDLQRVEDVGRATTRLRGALEAGRELGVDFVLFGSFTRFGEGASLDVQCAATRAGGAERPLREIFVHSGSIGDVIPDLDELVGKVTRFAIRDFELREEEPPELARSPDAMRRSTLEALRRRVDALEDEVARLREDGEGQAADQGLSALGETPTGAPGAPGETQLP